MRSRRLPTVLATALLAAAAPAIPAAGDGAPPRPVRVGLLLPSDAALALEVSRGAALAVARLTRPESPVVLVERRVEGHWGSEAGRVVEMVYGDGVGGIVTGPDRAASHLAAQVAAKARLPVITGSSAAALTRVPLPWVLRAVPDERRVLDALWAAVPGSGRDRSPLALLPPGREGDRLAEEVAAALRRAGGRAPRRLAPDAEAEALAAAVRADLGAAAFVALPAADAGAALRALRDSGWTGTGIGLPPPGDDPAAWARAIGPAGEGLLAARTFDPASGEGAAFARAWRERFDGEPREAAAAAHDAVAALVRAIRAGAGDGEGVRRALLEGGPLRGATGSLAFEADGNRAGPAAPAEVRGGELRPRPGTTGKTERKP